MAQALGRLLLDGGQPVVCVAGRDAGNARTAATFIGSAVEPVEFDELARRARRILIAVSDYAIAEVSDRLSASSETRGIVLHTCGALDESALGNLQNAGFSCGTIHPLQTVASPEAGVAALRGCAFAVSGDDVALEWAREIARLLDGEVLTISGENRSLYHAAAVMASNHVVALADAAQQMLASAAGVDGKTALRALAPLLRDSITNVIERGPAAALTGPIERGDAGTVRRHLQSLPPGTLRDLYCAAGKQTLDVAMRKGLRSEALTEIEMALRGK